MSLETAFNSLLQRYPLAAVLIGPDDELLHSSSQAARYLNHGNGASLPGLAGMLSKPLQAALWPALWQARQTAQETISRQVDSEHLGCVLHLRVVPARMEGFPDGAMLILFNETPAAGAQAPFTGDSGSDTTEVIGNLYRQLGQSRKELETLLREHDESSADLSASNEELHSINEELRCASAELHSSKHELEAINQKLLTVNEELTRRVMRAAKVNDDLQNFVAVTESATIFVDRGMRIQSYTSPAGTLFKLEESDRGKLLLEAGVAPEYEGFAEDLATAFERLAKIEREVRLSNGRWCLIRLVPYRTEDDFIEGVVITFIDVTGKREAEEKLRLGEERWRLALEASGDGMWDWDIGADKVILSPTWKNIIGSRESSFTTHSTSEWADLIHPEDRANAFAGLDDVKWGRAALFSCEYRIRCRDGNWKWVLSRGASVEWDRDGNPTRIVGTISDISEKKMSEERIWYRANFDILTGLPNRSFFLDRLEYEVRHAHRSGCSFALLFIDLDRFKEVNDLHGHYSGDALLKQVAQRLKACTRASDTVARLGGDEFTVILGGTDDVTDIELLCEEILERLAHPFNLSGRIVNISASVGATLYPKDAQDAGGLMCNADQAMYMAKNAGRNCCRFFTQAMQDAALARINIVADLHRAVPAELQLYFQPVVDARTGRIVKAEALLRWLHPSRGLILPSEFIPLAEEAGFVGRIGDWVFMEAARWALHWGVLLEQPFQISVNKSPLEFLAGQHAPLLDWAEYLRTIGLDCRNISIEITESVLLNANNIVRDKLLSLRQAGIEVAIDDFGTGYSSMSYLKKYSVDYLKIDQSFVRDMVLDATSRAITETIILMAHKLGLKVVAEGVETEEQFDRLHAAGCDYVQGYFFSEALPAERFEQLLLQHLAMQSLAPTG